MALIKIASYTKQLVYSVKRVYRKLAEGTMNLSVSMIDQRGEYIFVVVHNKYVNLVRASVVEVPQVSNSRRSQGNGLTKSIISGILREYLVV